MPLHILLKAGSLIALQAAHGECMGLVDSGWYLNDSVLYDLIEKGSLIYILVLYHPTCNAGKTVGTIDGAEQKLQNLKDGLSQRARPPTSPVRTASPRIALY